jgi:hypothetical protein
MAVVIYFLADFHLLEIPISKMLNQHSVFSNAIPTFLYLIRIFSTFLFFRQHFKMFDPTKKTMIQSYGVMYPSHTSPRAKLGEQCSQSLKKR